MQSVTNIQSISYLKSHAAQISNKATSFLQISKKLVLEDKRFLTGGRVQELGSVGIYDYQNVLTSHHKLVYPRIDADVYV